MSSKKSVEGPGVWVSCECTISKEGSFANFVYLIGVKGKEKQTVGELYDLFDSVTT